MSGARGGSPVTLSDIVQDAVAARAQLIFESGDAADRCTHIVDPARWAAKAGRQPSAPEVLYVNDSVQAFWDPDRGYVPVSDLAKRDDPLAPVLVIAAAHAADRFDIPRRGRTLVELAVTLADAGANVLWINSVPRDHWGNTPAAQIAQHLTMLDCSDADLALARTWLASQAIVVPPIPPAVRYVDAARAIGESLPADTPGFARDAIIGLARHWGAPAVELAAHAAMANWFSAPFLDHLRATVAVGDSGAPCANAADVIGVISHLCWSPGPTFEMPAAIGTALCRWMIAQPHLGSARALTMAEASARYFAKLGPDACFGDRETSSPLQIVIRTVSALIWADPDLAVRHIAAQLATAAANDDRRGMLAFADCITDRWQPALAEQPALAAYAQALQGFILGGPAGLAGARRSFAAARGGATEISIGGRILPDLTAGARGPSVE